MEGNARTWFTPKQKAELWERWRSGQCVADIARALERRMARRAEARAPVVAGAGLRLAKAAIPSQTRSLR